MLAYHAFPDEPNWFTQEFLPKLAANVGEWLIAKPW